MSFKNEVTFSVRCSVIYLHYPILETVGKQVLSDSIFRFSEANTLLLH